MAWEIEKETWPDDPVVLCPYCNQKGCFCEERVNCSRAGSIGHRQCGMCTIHDIPRILCGCIVDNRNEGEEVT